MDILNLAFNQQTTHLTCSTNVGFAVYKLLPSLDKKIFTELHSGVGKMKILNATNLSVLVGGGDNPFRKTNTVSVWDDHKKSTILEIELKEPVTNVDITADNIVIVTERRTHLCKLNNGTFIESLNTYANPRGICKITCNQMMSSNLKYIATLGKSKGEIDIWDVSADTHKLVKAHENNIGAVAINRTGSLIATASEIGTNIHIYNNRGEMLYKLRRGSTSTKVFDMCFSNMSDKLACYSANCTVHVFDIASREKNIQSTLSVFKNFLPEYFSSQWSFQQIYLDVPTSTPAILSYDKSDNLHVATYNGSYYKIDSDGKHSGKTEL